MTVWRLGALLILAALVGGCGGNSTTVGITVSAPGATTGSTATVLVNGSLQFSASVTGVSATTVYWQICLPVTVTTTPPTQPTTCTAIPGVTSSSASVLTGYGTISQTGLYTAPATIPQPNSFVVMASSTVITTDFGTLAVQVDSGVRVQLSPSTNVTLNTLETFPFTATVTGSSNTAVTWSVNGVPGGNATSGFICPNTAAPQPCGPGVYVAPAIAPGSVTIAATSVADPSKSASVLVTVVTAADPVITSLDPPSTAQGSAQQDVYIVGTNFDSLSAVFVLPPGQAASPVATTFISATLLRATIPGTFLSTAGTVSVEVQRQSSAGSSGLSPLAVVPVRPAVIAASADSVSQTAAASAINLTGGYFSQGTTSVQFNGQGCSQGQGVCPTINNSRQLSISIPAGALLTPGLYPIIVQNTGVSPGQPFMAALNLAVAPNPAVSNIPTSPVGGPVPVGLNPSAVAIDYASATAVVVNTGNGSANGTVSVINLAVNPPVVVGTITVGKMPTGVAVDDVLSPHVALVVNSVDQTVSTINLTTDQVVGSPLSVAIGPVGGSPAGNAPVPYSIGINPITHRAVVAYQSFNEATILDVSTGTPTVVQQIGGNAVAPLGTGPNPQVAVDPRLNWAVITPGGGGIQTMNLVDLGHNASSGDSIRNPEVVANVGLLVTGVGINSETHQAFFVDPSSGSFTSFSLLDDTVNSITFTNNGVTVDQPGFVAAASDPFLNVGIAVNTNSPIAAIVDLETGFVLQTVTLGSPAQAVAIDPVTSEAVVVSAGTGGSNGNVSVVSLSAPSNPIKPLQIVEASPSTTLTTASPLTLTITGSGFVNGSAVLLDGTPVAVTSVSTNGRRIIATVPANMLGSARRYAIQVQNPGSTVSNVTDLSVIQSILVGNSPVGVAVDTDRDLAVVTNSGGGTVSLIALSPTTPAGKNQIPTGSVGTIGSPISVGTTPLGVDVLPRLGVALVANNGSNNISLVDVTQTNSPQTQSGCAGASACTGQTGVAINQDTGSAIVTNSTSGNNVTNNTTNNISLGTIAAATTALPASILVNSVINTDEDPTAVAIDPTLNYAGIATSSQASSLEILNIATASLLARLSNFQLPSGIVFDPVNQVFLIANSLLNNVEIVDPNTLVATAVRVGINPASIAYDFQTSTLVTANSVSNTVSVLDYVCPPPPTGGSSACSSPRVRAVLGLGSSQQFSVAIDPRLNIAVLVDQTNNRVLLVPLPR